MIAPVPGPAPSDRAARTTSRGAAALAFGSIVSGVGAYLVIALGTRAVGETLFAPVSVLWSLWALTAAAISFPIQHWTIRSAETEGEGAVWAAMPRIATVAVIGSLVAGGLSLLLGTRLYTHSATAFAIMTALLPLGSLLVGFERGLLAHRGRMGGVAVSVAGENVVRAAVTLAVLVSGNGGEADASRIGWGIVIGFSIVALAPDILAPTRRDTTGPAASIRLLGGFAGANVAAQATLTSGPIVLALLAASPATVTQVFAILALLRVPYTGLVGASAGITGPLTRLVMAGRHAELRRLEVAGWVAALLLAGVSAALAPYVLPPLVHLLFATTVTLGAPVQAALAAGGVLAVAGLVQMLVLLTQHRPRNLLRSWGLALLTGAVTLALPFGAVERVALAFLLAELVALGSMAVASSPLTAAGARPRPLTTRTEGRTDAGDARRAD